MHPFAPTAGHRIQEERARTKDAALPTHVFSRRVRETLYRFALVRNSWGTTNIDAGPIELSRVSDLYAAYRAGITPAGAILPTEAEVLNYFRLVDALPTEAFEVTPDAVRALHRDYFRDVPLQNEAKPGQWKTRANVVSGPFGVLRTTPPADVEREVVALLSWLHGAGAGLPLLARTALFFHEFQRIHPFGDGNGRLGRLLTLIILSTSGLPNIRYCPIDDTINEDRAEYHAALRAADRRDADAWVSHFGHLVVEGYGRCHLLAARLQSLPAALPDGSQSLLEWCYIHKVEIFRVGDVRKFFAGASRATVTRRLQELDAFRFISGTGQGAGRKYRVKPLAEVE